jgi:hypothetical protein
MYEFKKGTDVIKMDGGKIIMHLSINTPKVENTFLIDIPSLNIHTYTDKELEIKDKVNHSLLSFFKYWILKEGKERLIEHMLKLGFTIQEISNKSSYKQKNIKVKDKVTFNYELLIQ